MEITGVTFLMLKAELCLGDLGDKMQAKGVAFFFFLNHPMNRLNWEFKMNNYVVSKLGKEITILARASREGNLCSPAARLVLTSTIICTQFWEQRDFYKLEAWDEGTLLIWLQQILLTKKNSI